MRVTAIGLAVSVVLVGCTKNAAGTASIEPPQFDAGGFDGGQTADAGPDAGNNDGGNVDAGRDGGTGDGGIGDGGTGDGGTGDGGTGDGGAADAGLTFGGPGPWPLGNVTYGRNDGIQETPVIGASTDEAQNLWVATKAALYLRRPTDAKFTRFDVKSGLHLTGNPITYCDSGYSRDPGFEYLPLPDKKCPITGAADPSGISEIVGGKVNEVFVGYNGTHDWNDPNDGSWADGFRHTGMLDRVTLKPDLSLQVDRMQMVSGVSVAFWHNRDVMRLIYDHFKHPHELYVGTNHGIDRMNPDNFTPKPFQAGGETTYSAETFPWMADHLHPQVCSCGPCPDGTTEGPLLLGDWRGLAVAANGNLLVGGRWGAGKIKWVKENQAPNGMGWFDRTGTDPVTKQPRTPYEFSMGDYYGGGCTSGQPVFCVGKEGDVVAISAVTETPDGLQWFASGPYSYQGPQKCNNGDPTTTLTNAGDKDLGVASYAPDGVPLPPGQTDRFTYYSPASDLGMAETNVRDMVSLPDGRIVFAGPRSGLVLWNPKTRKGVPMRAGNGYLPDDEVQRLELDLMVSPPALHVSTNSGATTIRVFP